jgi:hypothetical protein
MMGSRDCKEWIFGQIYQTYAGVRAWVWQIRPKPTLGQIYGRNTERDSVMVDPEIVVQVVDLKAIGTDSSRIMCDSFPSP